MASASATTHPFLFQGGYHTPGGAQGEGNIPNGLYHYGERYYDPTSGQWTQLDPQGGGYEFVEDDPVNATDPTGEKGGPGAFCGSNSTEHRRCGHTHPHYSKAEVDKFHHERCQTVGVFVAVAGYFLPEGKVAKAVETGVGIKVALSC